MKNSNGYVDSFCKLIQCPTVTNSGHEFFDKFHQVIDEEFPNVKANCEKIEIGNDVLMYRWKGKNSDRPIILMAHQDVVPAIGGDWKFDPYSATVQDGKVWGRGTMDCKNTLFSSIQACDELIGEGFIPEQDVYLSYSDCEETSGPGAAMARDYFKKNNIKPGICIDEGGAIIKKPFKFIKSDIAMVGIQEKGYMDVKFIARGKGGHSSQPPKNTPIARLGALINYVEKHQIFKTRPTKAAVEMIYGLGDSLKSPLKQACHSIKLFKGLVAKFLPKIDAAYGNGLFSTSIVFTMCQGAYAPNNIPQEAWVNANLRLSPLDSIESVTQKMEKLAKKYDCSIEVNNPREASPMVDLNSKEYKYYVEAIKKTYPDVSVTPYYIFGGTDCRTMQEICPNAIRCTPCILSMDQIAGMHGQNENIDVDSIGKCVECYKNFIQLYK